MGRALLIMVAGFAILLGSMRTSLLRVNRDANEELSHRYSLLMARNIANSACQRALNDLYTNELWRDGYDGEALFGGTYSTAIVDRSVDPTLPHNHLRIETTSFFSLDSAFVSVLIEKPSFARFAYFTDQDSTASFVDGDTLEGPVHTNGYFLMSGTPVFRDEVSSSEVAPSPPWTDPWGGGGTPQFDGDTEFGRSRIDLPTNLDALYDLAAGPGGVTFNQEVWIWLNAADASFEYWLGTSPGIPVDPPGPPSRPRDGRYFLNSINGVVATRGGFHMHVWGILDGQLTLVSSGHIWVEDNVLYAANPRLGPSDDILGLISEGNVMVAYDGGGASDPNFSDCEIHAAIMGLGTSFMAERYFTGGDRGTITVLGGIVQTLKGQISYNHPILGFQGYNKNYIYDTRLRTLLPPAYPLYADNVILAWRE